MPQERVSTSNGGGLDNGHKTDEPEDQEDEVVYPDDEAEEADNGDDRHAEQENDDIDNDPNEMFDSELVIIEEKAVGLPEQAIDFEGESEPNRPEVLEIASEFVAQRSSSSLEVNVDLNQQNVMQVDQAAWEGKVVVEAQDSPLVELAESETGQETESEDISVDNEEEKENDSDHDAEATSTTSEVPDVEPIEDVEPEIEASVSSRKRKWISPVSLRTGFFKGISLESLNILNLRKSALQPSSEVNSIAPSETNSASNSVQPSDDEDTAEAPTKKAKVTTDTVEPAESELDAGLVAKRGLSPDLSSNSNHHLPAYNPFSLPRLRGFFSRILNRVF